MKTREECREVVNKSKEVAKNLYSTLTEENDIDVIQSALMILIGFNSRNYIVELVKNHNFTIKGAKKNIANMINNFSNETLLDINSKDCDMYIQRELKKEE